MVEGFKWRKITMLVSNQKQLALHNEPTFTGIGSKAVKAGAVAGFVIADK